MPVITYRALDANGEPMFGNGQGNFLSDLDAVAQVISTRIKLLAGEWWEDVQQGTPLFQSILGRGASASDLPAIVLILQERILGAPYVLSISNVQTAWVPSIRQFTYGSYAETQFGTLVIQIPPGSIAAIRA